MLKVIEGGLGDLARIEVIADTTSVLRKEGQRRLTAAGVNRYEARELITGITMPHAVKLFKLQIEFAVLALGKLSPLPVDFQSDGYWPTMDADRDMTRSAPKG